jgi:hypothetical protein
MFCEFVQRLCAINEYNILTDVDVVNSVKSNEVYFLTPNIFKAKTKRYLSQR